MLKQYQTRVVKDVEEFFGHLDAHRTPETPDYISPAFGASAKYRQYPDRPVSGTGRLYPRVCIQMPTGGGKTLIAVETIRAYQNLFAKRKTGLVVWITHREQIYRQTIENLQSKSHPYRQLLDQSSGNRTLILEKGQMLRRQDVENNLVILMLMIQSAARDTNKIFEDNGFVDFFPPENRYDLHAEMLKAIPNLDCSDATLFDQRQVKTSLGNTIRTLSPLIIVDEFHTMFTPNAKQTLDGLNPSVIIGLSATPKRGLMNIVSEVSGRDLKAEEMIKLDLHITPPSHEGDWRPVLTAIVSKRDALEKKARKLELNEGTYIRPIALIQVERTGRDQRGHGFVHSEDVREYLIATGIPAHQIAVKSSTMDEIKSQKLLSKESEVRYIITKEALKEGWDCSFAYILGVIPNARNGAAMTQLVGRILRQPYAKKTGIADLDESYVYFASGHVQDVLENVRHGFDGEGLGDVSGGISVSDRSGKIIKAPRPVRIKQSIRKNHPESLYLPVWLLREGKGVRRFSYDADIRPRIDWSKVKITSFALSLLPDIGTTRTTQLEVLVGLEKEEVRTREAETHESVRFDILYLTRRLAETVENAFVAFELAREAIIVFAKGHPQDVLDADAGFIARELERHLKEHRKQQEAAAFESLLKGKKLELAVSDDPALGFAMPEQDVVENSVGSSYLLTLYDDVDPSSLNPLESNVARYIEQSHNVLWWARNRVGHGWYAIQGWRHGKVRPDFIIARKNDKDDLEFVYVVESKGEHLAGNEDTEYKDALFHLLNDMKGKITQTRTRLTTLKLNDHFDFELIPQGEEERRLRKKL